MRYFIVPNNLESDDCCKVRKVIKKERERETTEWETGRNTQQNWRERDTPTVQ